ATDIPGPAEVMDHSDAGLLVPPENSTALAGALVELLGDQQRRRQMGENARKRVVNHFSVQETTAAIEDIYEQLMDKQYSRPTGD
ncbi:MAG: glycosyltransferase, partial [Armatimonadota bacterium]